MGCQTNAITGNYSALQKFKLQVCYQVLFTTEGLQSMLCCCQADITNTLLSGLWLIRALMEEKVGKDLQYDLEESMSSKAEQQH